MIWNFLNANATQSGKEKEKKEEREGIEKAYAKENGGNMRR
jgi:hypothetical protein